MKRFFALTVLALAAVQAYAADGDITLTIENHVFSPKEVKLPAGKKVRLQVVNKDATPAEFESKPLGREKVIPGKSSAIILVGPLKPGRYAFVEEFHETQPGAQGTIVVE
jgi:plastocyanin